MKVELLDAVAGHTQVIAWPVQKYTAAFPCCDHCPYDLRMLGWALPHEQPCLAHGCQRSWLPGHPYHGGKR